MPAERTLTSRTTQIRVNTGSLSSPDPRAMVSLAIAGDTVTQATLDSIVAIAIAAWDCSDYPIGGIRMSESYSIGVV